MQQDIIVGIDEAGRGPLAGPVYVGVAAVFQAYDLSKFSELTDSKEMREADREAIFDQITDQDITGLQTSITYTKAATIDTIGINPAIQKAINRGLRNLDVKINKAKILLDGGLHAPNKYHQKTVRKGDQKHSEISMASVLAKVARDRKMSQLAEKYPQYKFGKHKGYGTKRHRQCIDDYGPCEIHRRSFIDGK